MSGVINAAMVELLSGLGVRQFKKLVRQLRREGADPTLKGRPWGLGFEDRVLLVIAYWRTNLTMRQIAVLFGNSNSAADRIIDDLAHKLALRPRKRFTSETVLIVDGTLVPTRDHKAARQPERLSRSCCIRRRPRHPHRDRDRRRWLPKHVSAHPAPAQARGRAADGVEGGPQTSPLLAELQQSGSHRTVRVPTQIDLRDIA
ncbi:hypothetical protein GCM10009853_032010 [Glycomyces scopariae]